MISRIMVAGVASVALAACTNTPHPLPPTEVRTVTVNVPIAVPCVKVADIPAEPPKVGSQLNGDPVHDLDVVAASNLRLRSSLGRALALLGACSLGNP